MNVHLYDVVVPTFRRYEKLKRFIDSFLKTNNYERLNLCLMFDNGDAITKDKIFVEYQSKVPIAFYLMEKQFRAFRLWNYFLKISLNRILENVWGMFYLCDDIEFFIDAFDVAIDILESKLGGDGVVGLNQENIARIRGLQGFCHSGMGLIGYKFAERFPDRQCFCPDYVSFKADNELGEFANSIGRFIFAEKAKIIHYHPQFNAVDKRGDETHNIVRDREVSMDRAIKIERKGNGFLWGKNFDRVAKGRWE